MDVFTPGRRQSKTLSTIDERGLKKLIETVFSIASELTNDNRKLCF